MNGSSTIQTCNFLKIGFVWFTHSQIDTTSVPAQNQVPRQFVYMLIVEVKVLMIVSNKSCRRSIPHTGLSASSRFSFKVAQVSSGIVLNINLSN